MASCSISLVLPGLASSSSFSSSSSSLLLDEDEEGRGSLPPLRSNLSPPILRSLLRSYSLSSSSLFSFLEDSMNSILFLLSSSCFRFISSASCCLLLTASAALCSLVKKTGLDFAASSASIFALSSSRERGSFFTA